MRYVRIGGGFFVAAMLVAIAACSGPTATGGGALPGIGQSSSGAAPLAKATPPVTAPVTIPYNFTNNWVTTTWAGSTSKPAKTPGSDLGMILVKFAINPQSGTYDVLEKIKSKTGYVEDLDSAIGFLRHKGGIAQIILSDDYSYVAGPFTETGMDTYPNGENSFDFPLRTGRRWSAAADHRSYVNESLSGHGAFAENVAYVEAADGTYRGQTSFSSTHHKKIEDNYASTTDVDTKAASIYTLAEPGAKYHKLTQVFEMPRGGNIDVRSEGRNPLPFPRGTAKVPDWYPGGGPLPSTLYADNFDVIGAATMPVTCRTRRGQHSTEVIERFANIDPVQGFYNTYTTEYYLASLSKGQYWFACIVENYTNRTYANGWAMSAGAWGGLSSRQVGLEVLVATKLRYPPGAISPGVAALPALTFPSLGFRARTGP